MPPMRDDHQGTPGRADLPRAARGLRRARRMQALRERDEVQAPHGDLALRRHAEARNPGGAEGLRGGEEPQRLTLYLEDDLTGRITPGERVVMNGVLRSVQKGRPGAKSTLFDIFMDVNSVEKEQVEFEEIEVTEEDARLIRETGSSPDIFRMITASIAPSMYGMYVEKEALALQLFSGVPKVMPDGRRIRGDIHVLMVGDPGVGKSELLSYMSRLSPRGIYATGKSSTAAGLTASAVRDE